jgi:hypothetical protein
MKQSSKFKVQSSKFTVCCRLSAACCLLALLSAPRAEAVFTKLGMAGAQFLKIGVGRPTGMGDAFAAVADDASATFWNPAGIALLDGREVLLNHIQWIADVKHDYLSFVAPTAAGNFAFAVTALTMGNMQVTTIDEPQGTGQVFSASDLAFGVSYARKFTDKFAFGATVKGVQERIWDMTASDIAFDFGVHFNTGLKSLRLGMAISNFGPDTRFTGKQLQFDFTNPDYTWPWTRTPTASEQLTETYPLPILFRFGFAYDLISGKDQKLVAAADLMHYNDVNEKVGVGLEYALHGFKLRAGYIINTDDSYAQSVGAMDGLSAGAGVDVTPFGKNNMKFGVDYGYRNLGRLGISHRVNLNIHF